MMVIIIVMMMMMMMGIDASCMDIEAFMYGHEELYSIRTVLTKAAKRRGTSFEQRAVVEPTGLGDAFLA